MSSQIAKVRGQTLFFAAAGSQIHPTVGIILGLICGIIASILTWYYVWFILVLIILGVVVGNASKS